MVKRPRCYLLLLCLPWLLTSKAYSNGINPPRPTGTQTVEASCTDRKSGEVLTVLRARVAADKLAGALEVRLGNASPRDLQLSQIGRVRIASGKSNSGGFAKAFFELREPSYEGEGFVRLTVKGAPVRLTGFSAALERVDIPLQLCRELMLKTSQGEESERGDVVRSR